MDKLALIDPMRYKFFKQFDGHLTPNSFSSDGRALYFSLADRKYKKSRIYSTKYYDGELSEPVLAGFSGGKFCSGASISEDGQTIMFSSAKKKEYEYANKEEEEIAKADAWSLWTSHREDGVWAEPTLFPAPIDSPKSECCAVYVNENKFFYSSKRDGNWDIFQADRDDDGNYTVEKLPDTVNSEKSDWPSSFDPETGLLLLTSGRPGGFGHHDIYASKLVDGQWQQSKILPEPINTASYDDTAIISPNGEWLYFSSNRPVIKETNNYSIFRIKASILD